MGAGIMATKSWLRFVGFSVVMLLWFSLAASAQDPADAPQPDSSEGSSATPEAAPEPKPPSREAELALRQSNLSDKYARLEKLLFDLAALEAGENPARAA